MTDQSELHALPMRFTFQFDAVRTVDINVVGPFSIDEADLLIEWLDLVKHSIRRADPRLRGAHGGVMQYTEAESKCSSET